MKPLLSPIRPAGFTDYQVILDLRFVNTAGGNGYRNT